MHDLWSRLLGSRLLGSRLLASRPSAGLASGTLDGDPDLTAHRLLQKAHNRDGLPEIAIGLCFLAAALSNWLEVAFPPGSLPHRESALVLGVLVPALILGSMWAIKKVRRHFLIEQEGYVKLKPVNRKFRAMVGAFAFLVAVAMTLAIYTTGLPPASWILAATGIGGGVLAVQAGRLPRYVVGGAVMAVTGVALAFSRVSLGKGYMILYGSMGILSLISGCVVLLLFLRRASEGGE
jgi:hypothetical protein